MAESIQHKLDRVRPPRVQITYDVEIGEAIEARELPFLMGVMADLSGKPKTALPKLKERKFVEIDRDNINDVMASYQPRIAIFVEDKLAKAGGKLGVELNFKSMDDFDPLNIVKQVPAMAELYSTRVKLNDLLGKMDGNEELEELLNKIMKDNKVRDDIKKGAGAKSAAMDKVLKEGKLMRDESQRDFASALLQEFVKQLTKEKVTSADSLSFIAKNIQRIDALLTGQLNEIMHHPDFQSMEGSWRGLHYLVMKTETGRLLKLRVLNITKKELLKDLERAVEFDQSQLFKKVYEEEYGTFGGTPYSCLLGDYEFGRHPQDMALLEKLSQVAAAAHAPFMTAASPALFDLDSFTQMGVPRDLNKIFENTELVKWNSFRNSEDSRYIALTLPRILMRLPYGAKTIPVEGINFEEDVDGVDNSKFCWSNSAYALAERVTNAVALYKWPAAIRGVEGGGMVAGLPAYTFKTTDGDVALKCPTEVAVTDRREKELSDLGFISLCHSKGTDFAAFFGGQTTQRAKLYNLDSANSNSQLSARLSYMLACSRFAHYIKVIMRDKVGSFMNKQEVSKYLNTWIAQYVLITDHATHAVKAKYPLREARIDVVDVPGKPGSYRATVFLRPHFQLEELNVSLRLVADLPPPVTG
ncbi:MAG: type VI secretion system contractile sheath large subunit [Pseudomonadota bacterium]